MRFKLLVLFVFYCVPYQAFAYYPATLWSSQKITETLIGIKIGHITGTENSEIITLFPQGFTIYHLVEGKIVKYFEYKEKKSTQFIKMGLIDLDQDGQEEVVLSRFSQGRVQSVVGKVDDQGFRILAETSGFLNVIFWKGETKLFLQKSFGEDDYSGPLYEMALVGKKLERKSDVRLQSGLSDQSISLYSVSGIDIPDEFSGFLHLSDTGKMTLFQDQSSKYVRKWTSSEDYGGSVFFYDREIRDILNQVVSKRFFVPVGFQFSQRRKPFLSSLPMQTPLLGPVGSWLKLPPESGVQTYAAKDDKGPLAVYVVKNTGYLKNVVGALPSIKSTQMVRLIWSGYGFQEEWNSPRLDGAITDFVVLDWDGDGKDEVLATFLLRDRGYWDTLKKQDSLLIVLKP